MLSFMTFDPVFFFLDSCTYQYHYQQKYVGAIINSILFFSDLYSH